MPHLQWTLCQRCVTLRRCLRLSHLKPVISLWPSEEDVCLDILLSSSIRLTGSVTAGSGTWARLIALQMMSFIWLWRCCLGAFLRQSSPSNPRASTGFPQHTHIYRFYNRVDEPLLPWWPHPIASVWLLLLAVHGASHQSGEKKLQEVWLCPHHCRL